MSEIGRATPDTVMSDTPNTPSARGSVAPSRRARATLAFLIGGLSAVVCGALAARAGAVPDFLYPLTAARLFLEGQNPYTVMAGARSTIPPYNEPFFYPFPAVIATIPFTPLPLPLACGIFFGLASGLLAWFITRDGLWRVHIFASAPFVVAAAVAQFSPLLMVMAFVPAAGFLAALKPNLGLALFAYRPSWRAVVGCVVLGLASLALFPSWPMHWLESLQRDVTSRNVHEIPLLRTGGFLLVLGVLAWRRAEARLLLVMSAVPQGLFFYDQLPLWLIPRTRQESIALTAASQLAMILWFLLREVGDSVVRSAYPYIMALIYLPALLLVMRHWHQDRAGSAAPGEQSERPV